MEPRPDPIKRLSARQLDVLRLAGEGLTNQEIAVRLGMKAGTVVTHMDHIFKKLGAVSRTQAAVMLARSERRGSW